MTKFGDELLQSLRDAAAHASGDGVEGAVVRIVQVPAEVDVAAIRKRLGLSRPKFAARFGLDVRAIQEWEQGRRRPDRTARALLKVIDRNPQAVEDALSAA